MPNNPTQDRYDPPQSVNQDFDPKRFDDIPVGEIFHLEQGGDPYRKTSEREALNTRMQTTHEVLSNIDVFVRI